MDINSKAGELVVVGIDLAKNSFQVHGVDRNGKVVVRKKLSRAKLAAFMATRSACLVGMEACSGAHHWARKFTAMGHRVGLMSPQFVKPYVKSNKNDAADAEAICEAVGRASMRFVPAKSIAQQDLQGVHRARSMAVSNRTAQVNQIRGLLAEYGIGVAQGIANSRKALPGILEDSDNELSGMFRELLAGLHEEFLRLDERVALYNKWIKELARNSRACERLMTIPGIGPLSATALVAAVDDGSAFANGREMAAYFGLVPRQHSTGGKATLLGISKRGDAYVRKLLIDGARAVLRVAGKKHDRRSRWVVELAGKRGHNIAAVALANKNARTVWALLRTNQDYTTSTAA